MSPREKGRASIWIISSCLLGDFYTIKRIHSFTPGFIDGKTWILKYKRMKIEDFFFYKSKSKRLGTSLQILWKFMNCNKDVWFLKNQ